MKFRKPLTITSRTSTITNGFVQAIIPSVEPTAAERGEALRILDMTSDHITCVYCGAPATDWDHLRPFVRNKRPTGYINEIRNLVPSCGPCNQSKSGADWKTWMMGSARGSPRSKGVSDLSVRIEKLERYERSGNVEQLRLQDLAAEDTWAAYWEAHDAIVQKLSEAQVLAMRLREELRNAIEARKKHEVAVEFDDSAFKDA